MKSKKTMLKYVVFILTILAPTFICVDLALADYRNGVTPADAWQLHSSFYETVKIAKYGYPEKVVMLSTRIWFVFPAAVIAGLLVGHAVWEPYTPPHSKTEDILVMFFFGLMIAFGMMGTLLNGGFGRNILDVTEISLVYSMITYKASAGFLGEASKYNLFFGLYLLFFPLTGPTTVACIAQLPFAVRMWMTAKPRPSLSQILNELEWKKWYEESERIRLGQIANSESSWSRPVATESSNEKPLEPVCLNSFREHLRKNIKNSKKRKDGEKEEAAENMQEFKRRVKEKDRTLYIA